MLLLQEATTTTMLKRLRSDILKFVYLVALYTTLARAKEIVLTPEYVFLMLPRFAVPLFDSNAVEMTATFDCSNSVQSTSRQGLDCYPFLRLGVRISQLP